MAVVASWDGDTRRIYLASGVTTFHPIDDIYREYRAERRTNEAFRKWDSFMVAIGNEDKGGGKATPRFLRLLEDGDGLQAKIVPFNSAATIDVTGEMLTEDLSDPFDYSTLTVPVVVKYAPAEAEIIYIEVSVPAIDAPTLAIITEARDEALLTRKLVDADEVLLPGSVDNYTLVDSDDGVTILRTKSVKDKSSGAVTLPDGAPARKTRS
jgi:hypothetical protein